MENLPHLKDEKGRVETELKSSKRRQPLFHIHDHLNTIQSTKKLLTLKKSVSIAKCTRRFSLDTLDKKGQEVISFLTRMPKKDRHLMTAQIKCFMMANHSHDSHLVQQRLCSSAMQKIRYNDRFNQSQSFSCFSNNFKYTKFIVLADNILKKNGDSWLLTNSFQQCLNEEKYPPTVHFMLLYLGIFLYSINAQYETAEVYCQKLFDMIVRFKVDQYFIIYLLMKVKIKTNLCEWEDSLGLLTKLVYFSWIYQLCDLEIWCYFELSRVYFFLQRFKQSHIFKLKSETNSLEPKRSIYRQVSISNLIIEIESIWQGQIDFKYNTVIEQTRLIIPLQSHYGVEQYITDQRKLKTNIKNIVQQCKIRHVGNLLTRIGELKLHNMMEAAKDGSFKDNQHERQQRTSKGHRSIRNYCDSTSTSFKSINPSESSSKNQSPKSGNNFLLTHKSYNKNMNMFFRRRPKVQQSNNQRIFYTIQNSHKNWGVLREMLRSIYTEMIHFCKDVTY